MTDVGAATSALGSPPLYRQLAELIADEIALGVYPEGALIPSSRQLASRLGIDPATAARGLALLTQAGVLTKRRGVGMLVARDASVTIRKERRRTFEERRIRPLVAEAATLEITTQELIRMLGSGPE